MYFFRVIFRYFVIPFFGSCLSFSMLSKCFAGIYIFKEKSMSKSMSYDLCILALCKARPLPVSLARGAGTFQIISSLLFTLTSVHELRLLLVCFQWVLNFVISSFNTLYQVEQKPVPWPAPGQARMLDAWILFCSHAKGCIPVWEFSSPLLWLMLYMGISIRECTKCYTFLLESHLAFIVA